MSDRPCKSTQPHERHRNGHTHEYCPGHELEFARPFRVMFDRQEKSVVLNAARVWRDPVGRVISVEDYEGHRWNWSKMLWWKPNEALAIEPRSPEDADVHAVHVVSKDS